MRTLAPVPLALLLALAAGAAGASRLPAGAAAGADAVITGRVTDAATGGPLPGAVVDVAGTRRAATAGPDGGYRLEVPGAAPGAALVVRASLAGFRTESRLATAAAGPLTLDFALRAAAPALDEVAVTGAASVRVESAAAAPAMMRSAAAPAGPYPGGWNTEEYDRIHESGFVAASDDPLSTFSIDVDRASYGNVRRFLERGELPPADAVRIEELVNYFPYAYPAPGGEHPVSVTVEVAAAPWQSAHRLVRVGLQAPRMDPGELPPGNLVFLVDVSGSMQSPDKLPLLKRSLRLLVDELRPEDRVALVVYAGAAGLVLPPTPGSERERILDALDRLEAGGSTAGGEGLRLAYDVARRGHLPHGNNRIVLATDGDFNVGVSSDAEMVRLVEERRRQGTFLTVLGFGTGNLKDSKMEKLADHGNGNYAYIDSELEARKVLVHEMGGTLLTVAKDVKVQVEFNPARVRAYRLIGYENRALADHEFEDDARDAGEMGAGHSVTALYEVVPAGAETPVHVGRTPPLRYREPARPSPAASGGELAFVRVRYERPGGDERGVALSHPVPDRLAEASVDLRFAAAVTAFGMALRGSEHRGSATLAQAAELAAGALGEDPEGYRAGFLRLVRRAIEIERRGATQEEAR